ncbi:copper amine oxidase N-terminal domain-containing protein [Paenibacillus sp. N3/727]|uniref:copper amine oxidase N-terminal domain-containing protein n=1 Tax=Paenibacillus sp. N3/727 TaxID=2925845 RepID=UPI001F530201|nr:copper amine oxidase N-terminal domain-containing protein [Paenibacillus sp. N3/727]UNK19520.1 copper amine oxidase N-terminal domain-containing protein [Paenibacillus sp. N3/727]
MKKKIIISVLATLVTVSTVFGAAYASGVIKINVNGKQVSTDVAPRMVNNRVMVPISFISKALGANVSWNEKTQTVSIKSIGIPHENVWNDDVSNIGQFTVAGINNTVQVFMAGMDTGSEDLLKKTTTDDMDVELLKQLHFSMGPTMLASQIMDMKQIKNGQKTEYQVRVAIQTWLEETTIDYWDLTLVLAPYIKEGNTTSTGGKMEYIVKKREVVKSVPIDALRVFPGYTLDFKK